MANNFIDLMGTNPNLMIAVRAEDLMDAIGKDELRCSAGNVKNWLVSGMLSCDKSDFRRVMRKWGIVMSGASNFVDYYWSDGVLCELPMQNTRYYL